MKTLFILIMIMTTSLAYSQDKSCCDTEATGKFSRLADNEDFRLKHPDPTPFNYTDMDGEMIVYDTPDGKTANGYFIRAAEKTNKWVLVFHEWYGLNDYIKQESDILKEKLGSVNILAIDLYDGKVADNRDDAAKYMQSVDQDRAINIIQGALNYCGDNAEIGTIGWCFGGGWSLNAALLAGTNAEACVMYYGMPSDDVEKLKTLDCPVLGIFAEQDGHITVEIVEQFKDNMKTAGEELTVHMYNSAHGFANPSNPKYDEQARTDAMDKTVTFLMNNLMN